MVTSPELNDGEWYDTQDGAFKAMEERKDTIIVKYGNYKFTSFTDQESFLDFMFEDCEAKDRQFYEVLLADKPQRMFADIDGEGLTITKEEVLTLFEKLMKMVFEAVHMPYKKKYVRVLCSTGKKISFHWSYLGGLTFKNSEEQKEFWKYVEYIIESDPEFADLCFLRTRSDNKMELKNVLDLGVYSKNRAMRTVGSCKAGSDRVLKPCRLCFSSDDGTFWVKYIDQFDPLDYLIYEGDSENHYQFTIPEYQKVKTRFLSRDQIEKLILKHVPNVEIKELKSRMFILKTVGTRTCIINGEENTSDNCYVIWRRDGLHFGCHDSGCEGQTHKICEFDVSPLLELPNVKTINDLHCLASKVDDWKKRQEFIEIVVAWMNQRYCVVKAGKTFFLEEFQDFNEDDEFVDGIKYKDLKSLQTDFMNKVLTTKVSDEECKEKAKSKTPEETNTINPLTVWLKHTKRREVDKLIFDPKLYFMEDNRAKNFYNLFDGFKIKKEDVEEEQIPTDFENHAFFYHILHRWCGGNEKVYNLVLNVFAHILQKPWEKLNIGVVLRSTERTGKGVPIQIFKDILGSKYFFQPSNPKQVLGDFNSQMLSTLVCFLDEMVWGGDKEKAGTLKKLVTEKTNYINQKHMPVVKVKNLANIFMASNEDWVVPAGATEQRWCVLNVSDELAICEKIKAKKIVADIRSINIRKLAKFFYDRDLTGWSHRETVNTQALRDQKIQSLSEIRRWWLNCLTCGGLYDKDLETPENGGFGIQQDKTEIYEIFKKESSTSKHMTETKFWIDMKHILGKEYKVLRKMVNGQRKYKVIIPPLEVCQKRWRELYNDSDWSFDSEGEEVASDSEASDSDSD